MKTLHKLALISLLFLSVEAWAFSYQGELSQSGALYTGNADVQFTLYDAETGGALVGPVDLQMNVVVENGRFVVDLEMWVSEFDGTPLWLEIAASVPAGGGLTTLSPRQKLGPMPYAEFAYAGSGSGTEGDITGVSGVAGITGGGTTGDVVLGIDNSIIQSRVDGACPTNFAVRSINANGSVNCDIDNDSGGDITAIIAGSGINISGNGFFGDATVNVDGTAFWSTSGNAGTTAGTHYFGTSDFEAVEIKVNGRRIMRFEPQSSSAGNNVIGGSALNSVPTGVQDATISGGGIDSVSNCGPANNQLCINSVTADGGTIGGGYGNLASAFRTTVAGGARNSASSANATVGGGNDNHASGSSATVPGGIDNQAGGSYSFAAGRRAKARNATQAGDSNGDEGTFVWADSTLADFTSSGPDQFLVQASGGMVLTDDSTQNDPLNAQLLIDTNLSRPIRVRVNGADKLFTLNNGGTSIGSGSLPPDDGLRVQGETYIFGRVGLGTSSPSGDLHIAAAAGASPLRVQIGGATRLHLKANGGLSVGSNLNAPTDGIYVQGDANINGTLSKGAGSFKIDHPLDPENQYLYHSFVESPDMMNVYNGNIITDDLGEAWIELPDWFEELNREFRYQLTVIGSFARAMVAEEVLDNRFLIRTDEPVIKVSWQITGIRQDPFAERNRIPVEQDKPREERGTYLHPKAWGIEDSAKFMARPD